MLFTSLSIVLFHLLKDLRIMIFSYKKDYDFVCDMAHYGYVTYEEGLAIISGHPITSHESFFVSDLQDMNNWKTRKIFKASVSYKGQDIQFFSGHFG